MHWRSAAGGAGLTPLCLLILSGCANVRSSPEVQLTVNGCPRLTQCRLERSVPCNNGDLNVLLDETEAAWVRCADKVDTIIACQERNSEQAAVFTTCPK
ncbi:Rz1-like lysis system protein LysC [Kosakonia cowanii]|uniref:Rz1-like lysis system protein LysC n=1 Tax=Kosakonia cowanii TaxID=208223 RepID=UPI002898B2FB|nr:Rz1-like lysis system protein LysC [Kosakonia cowanii]